MEILKQIFFFFGLLLIRGKFVQAIELLLNYTAGFVHGQPTLQPGTDYYCPQVNETLTFFCNDSRIFEIEWIVEGYISPDYPIRYAASLGLAAQSQSPTIIGNFTGRLINITEERGDIANMITELVVDIHGLNNGTNITCRTLGITGHDEYSSSVIYYSGFKIVLFCQYMHACI